MVDKASLAGTDGVAKEKADVVSKAVLVGKDMVAEVALVGTDVVA